MFAAAVCLKSTAWRIARWMGIHQAFYQLVWSKNPAVLHSDMPEYCILSVWGLLFDNAVFKRIFLRKPFTISPAPVYTVVSAEPHRSLNLFCTKGKAQFASRRPEPIL